MTQQQRTAWLRYRFGQITVAVVGLIYAGLAVHLRPLPEFEHFGPISGQESLLAAAVVCWVTAIRPDNVWLRALSGAAVVGAAGWRAVAAWTSLGIGPALVWSLVVVLLLSTWTYLLPPAVAPPRRSAHA